MGGWDKAKNEGMNMSMYELYQHPEGIPVVIVMALLAYLWGKNGDLKTEALNKEFEARQERAKHENGNN